MTLCGDIKRTEKFFAEEVEHHRIDTIYERFLPFVKDCQNNTTSACKNLRTDFVLYKDSVKVLKTIRDAKENICNRKGDLDCVDYRESVEFMDSELIKYAPYYINIPPARKSLLKTAKSYRNVLQKKCPTEFSKYQIPSTFPKLKTSFIEDLKDYPKMIKDSQEANMRKKFKPAWDGNVFLSDEELKIWKKVYHLMESKNEHFHWSLQPINKKQAVIDMDIKTKDGFKEVACFFHVPYESVGHTIKGKKAENTMYDLNNSDQFKLSSKLLAKDLLNKNLKKTQNGLITSDNKIRFRQSKQANGLCFRFIL